MPGKDLFICLDNATGTLGSKQMQWLKDTLKNRRDSYRNCVIFTHINFFREHQARVKQPDWPKEIDAKDISYSALNHVRGNLLPGDLKRFFRMTWIQRAF